MIAATGQLSVPDYSAVFEKLENTQKALEDSLLQNQQVRTLSL
jgi:hypothetical protein